MNMASELLHRLAKPARKLEKAAKTTELTWRYGFHLVPTLRFRLRQPALAGESARVFGDLNRNGVALTSVAALLGPNSCFGELSAEVARLQNSLQDRIAAARSLADTSEIEVGKKTFLLEYLDGNPAFDLQSIYTRFALQPNISRIANAYVGMLTRMRYCNVWHNFASHAQPRESQLWHRDPEDLYIVKVFLYLSDVDQGAGPFTYAPGTHGKGRVRRQPDYILEGDTKRSTDAQMAAVVPRDEWVTCTGPRGTIVFADTRGYHKGGLSKERDRVLYTCMFTS
jgi:Phytanoyl-CoA dioxygenase (PhyH)